MKPIDVATGLRTVIEKLEIAKFDYMIVGSVAGAVYGEPRLTKDLDLVLALAPTAGVDFASLFNANDFYVPPLEIISQEIVRGGQLNLLHHQSGLKVDLIFRKNAPHALTEFGRRRRVEILTSLTAWIASPEDVIIAKLKYFREGQSEKHLTDIRGIFANTVIDREYLTHWLEELGLESSFAKI